MQNLARTKGQLLSDHLQGVAQLTADGLPERFREVGWYAGLWHDLGKYIPQWQSYLQAGGKRVPHSAQGAMLALSLCSDGDRIPAIAFAIAAHHTGLKDPRWLESRDFEAAGQNWREAIKLAQQEIAEFLPETLPDIDINWHPRRREFAIRMLFSALVDSDRLDAMLFEQKEQNPCGARVLPQSKKCFNPRPLPSPKRAIDELRNAFAEDCIKAATQPKGLYRLTGVCGIGKTEASLRFALLHQEKHEMAGIIYVGPLKSIIEQTAKVYRNFLGAGEFVLEHHSGFEPTTEEIKDYQLDTERWDKPIIVTSGVQFYESLFSNRPTQCRKLHNIANRVILIDEAQTVPLDLAIPILDVLETLVADWGCTVVLMSATQPAFDRLELCHNAIDIIPSEKVQQQFQSLERVTYRIESDRPWNWQDLAADIHNSGFHQSLTVVNTTKLSREGYQALSQLMNGFWFHLSGRMCPAHRKEVLAQIQSRLENQLPCHLISTQVIEAGVDVDFPRVYRQMSPLDSIIQTAGRCNRNNQLKYAEAIVTIFELEAGGFTSSDYAHRIEITRKLLREIPDPLGENILQTIQKYFLNIYNSIRQSQGKEIQKLREQYDFLKVNENFKVIDDEKQQSVVVLWQGSRSLIEDLQPKERLTEQEWRLLQPYTVTLPRTIEPTEKCSNGMRIWRGEYNEFWGLKDQ